MDDLSTVKHEGGSFWHHEHLVTAVVQACFEKPFDCVTSQQFYSALWVKLQHLEKLYYHLKHVSLDRDAAVQ